MKKVVWGLVILLIILHQDFWLWNDSRLVFGFIPITLFYQCCISLGAAFVWYLATIYAWPFDSKSSSTKEGEDQ